MVRLGILNGLHPHRHVVDSSRDKPIELSVPFRWSNWLVYSRVPMA